MTKTILVVEDDDAVREMLVMLLESSGFSVCQAARYQDAVKLSLSTPFHLVLLDWMLPGGSGIDFIKHLKQESQINLSSIPIILLTAKQAETDQVIGLDTGADDYITKPFSNKQLIARINALLRRSYPDNGELIKMAGLTIDVKAQRVIAGTDEINLGPTEYKLLSFFMRKPNRVFSRDQLIDHVWGRNVYIDDRTIDVHIGRLRKQLEASQHANLIQTVRGAGYRFSTSPKTPSV